MQPATLLTLVSTRFSSRHVEMQIGKAQVPENEVNQNYVNIPMFVQISLYYNFICFYWILKRSEIIFWKKKLSTAEMKNIQVNLISNIFNNKLKRLNWKNNKNV
jgi:hypothetical protein